MMSRIKIKNFGPIKEGCEENEGWIEIKKVTVFIGDQGAGKSTVAKLISIFTWIEKALVRGDYPQKWFERKNKLKNQFLNYHRIENYINEKESYKTLIQYDGDAYSIRYENGSLNIEAKVNSSYSLPQLMYVPAERNFIAYVKTPKELRLSSDSLKEFLTEFDYAKEELKEAVKLPLEGIKLEYDRLNDILNLRGDGYKTRLTEASSGMQSLVPLFLVSDFMAKSVKKQSENNNETMSIEELQRFKKGVEEIWKNSVITEEQRRAALSVLSSKFTKKAFINIVEEPEQNLFPSSQRQILLSLLEFNNLNPGNKLIITTHSPYIINYLNIVIQAAELKEKITTARKQENLLPRLKDIVPESSLVFANDVVVYQLDENGSIKKLPATEGILTDKNYLNDMLRKGNEMFDSLLEIEEEI